MIERLRTWFTLRRREAIYAAAAAVSPLLVWAGYLTDGQAGHALTLTSVVLQAFAGALALSRLSASETASWFSTKGRAVLYGLATAAAPAAVGLGWVTEAQSATILTGVSLGLTALASIVSIVNLAPDPEPDDTTPVD